MDASRQKRYVLFLSGAVALLIFTGYSYFQKQENTFSTASDGNSFKELIASTFMNKDNGQASIEEAQYDYANEKNRVTNDNCGLSFTIPEGWIIDEIEESDRFCHYRIDNPHKRGAKLSIGVPRFEGNITWDMIMKELDEPYISITPTTIAGQQGVLVKVARHQSGSGIAESDPMYIFKKSESVFYVRYGYPDADEDVLDEVSSVVSSIRFIREDSYYEMPMYGEPQ